MDEPLINSLSAEEASATFESLTDSLNILLSVRLEPEELEVVQHLICLRDKVFGRAVVTQLITMYEDGSGHNRPSEVI